MKITYGDRLLQLSVEEIDDRIYFTLKGKIVNMIPSKFIRPLLGYIIEYSRGNNYPVIFDFRLLTSINSSTNTPFVRVLEAAQESPINIEILYYKGSDLQEKIFSALKIFQTDDKRINIKGIKR